ncbi:acetyltransferase family protein, partial [Vibrio cholerae HC-17A2]
FGCCV